MKLVLLFSVLCAGAFAQESLGNLVSTDRYLLRIIDRPISQQDLGFQLRNLRSLHCIYEDSLVVLYFGLPFVNDLDAFLKQLPSADQDVRKYLHQKEDLLKKLRYFFKLLRYSEDQRAIVSPNLASLVRESTKENRCGSAILYKDTLKTNFLGLLESELYLRARYGNQVKTIDRKSFDTIKASIDLFMDSLDKQFTHENYW